MANSLIQVKGGSSSDRNDGGRHGRKWSGYGYILKIEPTVGLSVGMRRGKVSRMYPKILL